MNFLTRCEGCRKKKLFIKRRRFWSEPLKTYITSNEPICLKCKNIYKSIK